MLLTWYGAAGRTRCREVFILIDDVFACEEWCIAPDANIKLSHEASALFVDDLITDIGAYCLLIPSYRRLRHISIHVTAGKF